MSARAAYEGYAAFTGGKTFDGRPMPTWDELPERIRGAWEAALVAGMSDAHAALDAALDAAAAQLETLAYSLAILEQTIAACDGLVASSKDRAQAGATSARAVLVPTGETGGGR